MKDKKLRAISPVIATLLLIIVAVIAGVALYTFVSGFISQTTTQSKAPSSIVIDAASISGSSVTAYVRNVGQTNTTVVAIYVLDASDLSLVGGATTSQDVTSGAAVSVSETIQGTTKSGHWYIVQVVTVDGSSASIKVKAD